MLIHLMDPAPLILKRASANRPSGERSGDNYDVLADELLLAELCVRLSRRWSHRGFGRFAYGYAATREAAMAAFAKSWQMT